MQSWRPNHYGRVPAGDALTWTLTVSGATAAGVDRTLSLAELQGLGHTEIVADHHCASRRSVLGVRWGGVPCAALLDAVPPAPDARYLLAYAMYGYHANVTIDDLRSPHALLATHLDGVELSPEHGRPLRLILPHLYGWKGPKWLVALDYLVTPRRGFWEERGYHVRGDVWREERYAHQE